MPNTKQNSIFTKSVLTILLSFVFLSPISLLVTAEKALAQSPFEINNTNAEPVDITNDPINGGGFEVNNTGVTGTDLNQIPNIQNQTQRQPEGLIKNNTVTKNTGGWEQTIGNAILQIAAYITYFGGSILEIAIEKLVFGMGTLLKDGIGNSIDSIWTIIRDISNLAFIFGFIYVGIRTIINPDSADTKRFLAQIIIGALLINFSLFFTKIVIDFSNYSAVQIYNTMINNPDGNISYAFAQKLGVTGLYAPPSTPDRLAAVTGAGHLWFYVMGAIMLVVAGFVLAAGGILLIVRFVALIFIMMFSPILFAATIFPQTEEYATDLWAKLISYSFFAPVYLLLLIASLKVLEGATNALGIGATATVAEGILSGKSDSYGVILNFVIVIMFLIFSLQVAQRMGIKGGEMAVSAGDSIRKRAQSAIGRNTVGRASNYALKKYEKFDARTKDSKGWNFAKTATKIGTLGAIDDRTVRGTLKAGKTQKFGGNYSYEDDDTYNKERKARQANTIKVEDYKNIIANGTRKNPDGTLITLDDTEQIKFERAIADATLKDNEELSQEQREATAGLMTQSQVDALMKSEKLTEQDKANLARQRKLQISKLYTQNKELLSKANSDQLGSLGEEYLSTEEHAVRLTSSQMDDLKKKFTPTEFKRLSDVREKALMKLAEGQTISTTEKGGSTGNAVLTHEFILKQKPSEIAKMPSNVLVQMAEVLPVATLAKITQDATINTEDQKKIKARIEAAGETRLSQTDKEHIDSVKHWFIDVPLGKQFGK